MSKPITAPERFDRFLKLRGYSSTKYCVAIFVSDIDPQLSSLYSKPSDDKQATDKRNKLQKKKKTTIKILYKDLHHYCYDILTDTSRIKLDACGVNSRVS
jgi:hypothetical protein